MRVMKFGSSTMRDADGVRAVAELVRAADREEPVVVVVSALAGATDELELAAQRVLGSYEETEAIFGRLHARHIGLVEQLVSPDRRSAVTAGIQMIFNNLEDVLHGVNLVGEHSAGSRNLIVGFGEMLGARILTDVLAIGGVDARFVDSRPLVRTTDGDGARFVDVDTTLERLAAELLPAAGVAVLTGRLASTADGVTSSLGRHGGDYTATLAGAATGAADVQLWTDVDGMFSADPAVTAEARVIPAMTYDEAQEMAYFGAAVVHPLALQPAAERGIPVLVRNAYRPDSAGTVISADAGPPAGPIRGITTIEDVALVNLEGSGMIGVPGVAGRLFTTLAERGINVIMISQASSEHSICFVVRGPEAAAAVAAVEKAFAAELDARLIQRVERLNDLAVLSVIGSEMRGTVGLAGRLFGALGEHGVNVLAVSQGSSERNVSIVVAKEDEPTSVQAVHRAFGLGGGA